MRVRNRWYHALGGAVELALMVGLASAVWKIVFGN